MENEHNSDELMHYGTLGMRWGIRRYQNKDGSLKPAGVKRYNKEVEKLKKETAKVKAEEKILANRRKTDAKLNKLEAQKMDLEARKKALKDAKRGKKPAEDPEDANETVEQRREKALKSTDPNVIYKNKDLLTYQELAEKVNRIDLETRLQSKVTVEHQKTGMEKVDELRGKVDKANNLYRSIDNAYSSVKNSSVGKDIAKALGIETPKKAFDLEEFWKNRAYKSTQETMDALKKVNAERLLADELSKRKGVKITP